MINELHELRDLLDEIERDGDDFDQGAIDRAFDIVDALILRNEEPLAISAVGLCYRVPTPYSPASAPPPKPQPPQPQPKKSRRPKSQQFEIRRKRA